MARLSGSLQRLQGHSFSSSRDRHQVLRGAHCTYCALLRNLLVVHNITRTTERLQAPHTVFICNGMGLHAGVQVAKCTKHHSTHLVSPATMHCTTGDHVKGTGDHAVQHRPSHTVHIHAALRYALYLAHPSMCCNATCCSPCTLPSAHACCHQAASRLLVCPVRSCHASVTACSLSLSSTSAAAWPAYGFGMVGKASRT